MSGLSSFISGLFSSSSEVVGSTLRTSADLTVTSSRFVTSPIVSRLVNNLAFLPPARSTAVLHELSCDPAHTFITNGEYKISLLTSTPKTYKASLRECIVFSHGNGSDILSMRSLCDYWADVFMLDCICYDYPGYGLSVRLDDELSTTSSFTSSMSKPSKRTRPKTYPTEEGCYNSMKIVMDHLRKEYDVIYIVGQSLGTGICVDYCAKYAWKTPIVLISPYKSIARVIADSCATSAIDSSFNTYEKVDKLKCPVKIFHGDSDTLIHISHGEDIYKALLDKKLSPVWLKNVGHNDILDKITTAHLLEVFRSE
ncbi:alpha/beta hydrolase family protein [Yasminevirus sp. GU-2018]|uniref:Alpha/beta hydrolase family protein n=1 Tax=Yasminevirus sp. GU-2018 TaxID=2420051 RepID=A0A5K0U6P4_9VIRU|nr:alpha/beta hydrolase family protein [Yasminevirus sp. GU-2018]